ncbi:unnamed protein product [Nesidiocoris tenuis]|uniref:DDHD domain-containing protein n=1 Tax=Nesidiocoris tenuis TaxID=355587 RepID=A0A6H5HH06_9HEMI|nr:unnamed protein product [Nesidiocoris tenuis]
MSIFSILRYWYHWICEIKLFPVHTMEDFRSVSLQLVQSHFRRATELGQVGRVEVLPVEWHQALHTEAIDKRLDDITLPSIPKAREFTNNTILDVLFYSSPMFSEECSSPCEESKISGRTSDFRLVPVSSTFSTPTTQSPTGPRRSSAMKWPKCHRCSYPTTRGASECISALVEEVLGAGHEIEPPSPSTSSAPSVADDPQHHVDVQVGSLNGGNRIDYVLQEAPLEHFNQYISAVRSHFVYWESEDTMLMVLKQIYETMDIKPDSQVAQQILPFDINGEDDHYTEYTDSIGAPPTAFVRK